MADGGWRRVCVIGCSGAGKSTLARRLGEALDLPVVHLDHHFWRPGWVPAEPENWRVRVAELAAGDSWILDGNYGSTLDLRLARADLVVFVDYPRRLCLARAFRRLVRSRGRPWNIPGCPERIDRQFFTYVWRWPRESRPRTWARVERYAAGAIVVRLPTPRATNRWLRAFMRSRHRGTTGRGA